MIKLVDILIAPIQGAYYYEDVSALQSTSVSDDERWFVKGETPGYLRTREIAEGVSIGLVSSTGKIFWGDAVAVSYSGKAGRKGPFRTEAGIAETRELFTPNFIGTEITSFRSATAKLRTLDLSPALTYGISQGLLAMVAGESQRQMSEVICSEWNLPINSTPVALQGSCGNDRYDNADKMFANRLEALPHTQVDDIPKQLGYKGEILSAYVDWLVSRADKWRDAPGYRHYKPMLHLDVHGAIGKIFDKRLEHIADYLISLESKAGSHPLRMESVILEDERDRQIETYFKLKKILRERGSRVQLVADEWANRKPDIVAFAQAQAVDAIHIKMPDVGCLSESLDCVLACREAGVQSLLGGSCIETEISTKASVHLAMASRPNHLLCKPGMGVNEAIMLAKNEMNRISTILKAKIKTGEGNHDGSVGTGL